MPNFFLPSRFYKSSTYIEERNTFNILLMLGYWLFSGGAYAKFSLTIKILEI